MTSELNTKNRNGHEILRALQSGLTVSLISTRRENFSSCNVDEELETVVGRSRTNDFDFLPVLESTNAAAAGARDTIIGLIEIAVFRNQAPPETVREYMQPLSEKNLIGADASILDFVRDADRQRCRLVVSGPDVSGLVSLFDLQQLPARAALFAMITQLEIAMANQIRREFDKDIGWIELLSSKQRCSIKSRIRDAKSNDTYVDGLLFTGFADKIAIIKRSKSFIWQNTNFDQELNQIRLLRNAIAHAHDYARTQSDARQVCQTVRLMDDWIARLTA